MSDKQSSPLVNQWSAEMSLALRELTTASQGSPSRIVDDLPSTVAAIAQCCDLLSRFWPIDGTERDSSVPTDATIPFSQIPIAPPPGTRLGRFEIRRVLGYGGFGIVLLVYDDRLEREAALKIPRPDVFVSRQLRELFVQEARAAAALDHAGIVPIFEIGEIGPVDFILSAYCKGPTLKAWLADQETLVEPRTSACLVHQLAEAVHHAHVRGILHRDIKPANILLEPLSDSQHRILPFVPRLTDFGLAKLVDQAGDGQDKRQIVGTPSYMAPEQAAGKNAEVGVHSDIYSLGVILFELLTGKLVFAEKTGDVKLKPSVAGNTLQLKLRDACVPADLAAICRKCLNEHPADRYSSAHDLAVDLDRFSRGESVSARPLHVWQRIARWCGRHPLTAILALGMCIALVAGMATAGWQWRLAERNLEQAEQALLDFAWIVEESALWSDEAKSYRDAAETRLREYHTRVEGKRDVFGSPSAIAAALDSFEAGRSYRAADYDAACDKYHSSLRIWLSLVRQQPERLDYRRPLALNLLQYGRALYERLGRPRATGETDPLRKFLCEHFSGSELDTRIIRDLAMVSPEIGRHFWNANRKDEAQLAHEIGLAAAQSLLERNPKEPTDLFLCGQLARLVGDAKRRSRDREGAHLLFDESCAHLETLMAISPNDEHTANELVATYLTMGNDARQREDWPAAKQLLTKATVLSEQVLTQNPVDQVSRLHLMRALRELGYVQLRSNQQRLALDSFSRYRDAWQTSLSIDADEAHAELRERGHALHQLGVIALDQQERCLAQNAFEEAVDTFNLVSMRTKLGIRGQAAFGECLYFVANTQLSKGRASDAVDTFKKAIEILRPQATAPNARANVKSRYRQCLDKLASLESRDPDAITAP